VWVTVAGSLMSKIVFSKVLNQALHRKRIVCEEEFVDSLTRWTGGLLTKIDEISLVLITSVKQHDNRVEC
jgi:hypothetical protein